MAGEVGAKHTRASQGRQSFAGGRSGIYRITLCLWCKGSGYYPSRGNRCTACGGKGKVRS